MQHISRRIEQLLAELAANPLGVAGVMLTAYVSGALDAGGITDEDAASVSRRITDIYAAAIKENKQKTAH